jgi:alkylhydroperoxidase/carboxymuconolactone decarboxylase family protein YurZ
MQLRDLAYCRAGDKGDVSNVVVIPRHEGQYEWLKEFLTVQRVTDHFGDLVKGSIDRYEMPGIKALNFVMRNALGGGVSRSLSVDPHGKARASLMLDIEVAARLLAADGRPADATAAEDADATTVGDEDLLGRMKEQRGYLLAGHEFLVRHDPEFAKAYNDLVSRVALYQESDRTRAAVGQKYREFVYVSVLATRGFESALRVHVQRALDVGASVRELIEVFETVMIPGGASAFLLGMRILSEVVESAGSVSQ